MKRLNVFYWVVTLLFIPMFGIGALIALIGSPAQEEVLTSLGYPTYLLLFLSISKILALIAIFSPKLSKLKEWAYAGLIFDVMGAIYSILTVHHSWSKILIPLFALVIVFTSYSLYHIRRKHQQLLA